MIDHIGIQAVDMATAAAFYDAVLPTIGGGKIMDFGEAIGYGRDGKPDFWISKATSDTLQHEAHVAFEAPDRAAVDAWFKAAVDHGAEVLHEPKVWPEYHPGYYGAFVRDPDGNNVEAVHHTFE
ncbi:MAG: VOC family protein [Acidimicrobiia bacterium]|nr:VOC family protein [Acidimicrobiia bacterium]